MLLTKTEQEKIQAYIEKQLIINQQDIRNLFEDLDLELPFIDYMINKDYKHAFEACTKVYNVHGNAQFMRYLLNMFYPSVDRDWAKYFILVQTETSDDFELFDKCLTNECKAFEQIYLSIYA